LGYGQIGIELAIGMRMRSKYSQLLDKNICGRIRGRTGDDARRGW